MSAKDLAAFHFIRGTALEKVGHPAKAVAEYEQAVATLDMAWQSAERLAWIYSTTSDEDLRKPEKALAQYQRFARYAPSSRESPALEAAVHAVNGDFSRAIEAQRTQVAFTHDDSQRQSENAVLALYQKNKIRILRDTAETQHP